jgi:spore coat protein U-like protein
MSEIEMRTASPHPRSVGLFAAAALLLAAAGSARAAPCFVFATGVAFGNYNPVSATPTDSTGNIFYYCPQTLPPVISISAGNSGSFSPRFMTLAPDQLNYNLSADAARTVVWGDGTGGSSTVVGSNAPTIVTATVYGRAFPLQSVGAGNYTDTLLVTFNF